ncbi:lateral signaling target protein 2 homolog [Drosophila busckii]|uniref:lateral signaling target protein 2 homolog n=1 Tax=Drosophila busckii TaxID=30019 RepID=UPI0014333AB7|nr:lateral signaling target protein 2 homolog [Drosophila busckii]
MTEYMTSNINSVLKNYQNSAPKSLQGPAVIKKEILSSPEPHELLHHHEINSAGVGVAAAALPGETTGAARQLFVAPLPLPPELSQPILSQPDLGCGELYETRLEGKIIGCFSLGGEMRLCLPQFLNNVLNDFTLDQINKIFDELGIYCSQCTPEQLVEFKAAKILPSDVKASGLITRTDAERLCAALLPRSDRNSYMHVDDLAKGAISFQVYHKCFGKCEGICTPDMYSYQKPTCIKCLECKGWFSPQKFVGHVHRKFENRTCHWGFDSRNWHDYLHVALNVENREKYQRILDQLKEVELKEMHKAQCELDHKKRKADMLMEDALLAAAPLGLVAPQAAHQPLATSLKYQHHHQLIELPSKKHKSAAAAAAAAAAPPLETYTLGYQLMYAHCVQQQQRELEREQQHVSSCRAAAWSRRSCRIRSVLCADSDRERFERTYQPNVALAPRKSILSKERERERTAAAAGNSNSSNSSSPMPKQKSRSPAEDCCAGSNEITSSTSPVPAATAAATLTAAAATAGTTAIVATAGGAHIIATVNQHAKLLPTSSNHHSLETSRIRINKNLLPPAAAAAATITLAPPSGQALLHYKTPCYSPTQSSSAGLNLSTHSSNVVSSPQLKTQQQSAQQQQQQPLPLTNGHKPHLGSEFELSTDTDDDSLNGEPDSSAMLPPWELAVEALRDTRPKERERVLQLLQRLLQENQQCRYNNAQLSEHLHKQEAHIAELSEQLQCYRRQLETLEKLRVGVLPLKQQQQQEQAQDQANNNNHNNHLLEQEPLQPASKRLKLLQEEEEEDSNQSHSSNSCEQQQPQQPQQQQQQLRSDEEEDELEELDEDEEELLALPTAAEAPHSSACATPPTATTPISPDSAATAGQLFDSSNSSDECSMKKAQMSACQALDKISSNGNNNNSNNNNSSSSNSQQQSDAEEEEEEEESDDDEMPLQQRQQHQQQQIAAPTPVLMATKASKKQTPPTPTASPITTATAAAAITTAAATTTTTTAATISTTNCDLQIKKELA